MTARVLAPRRLPDAGWEILRKGVAVTLLAEKDDELVPRERILASIREAAVLVCLLTEAIDKGILEAGKRLRGVANMAVGFNNIDVAAATSLGLPVSNTPGVLTDTTADLAFALLLAVARNVVPADHHMREGRFKLWGPSLFLGADVSRGGAGGPRPSASSASDGSGRPSSAARGASTCGSSPSIPPLRSLVEKTEGVEYAEFETLLDESDFVTLHTDLNPSIPHLFNAAAFERMKPNAILVNTSRGPLVDEKALVEALREGKIAGARLDVYEEEPRMAPGLAELENVVVLPHVASASFDTRNKMATMCAENAGAHLVGVRAPNCVNPEVYEPEAYRKRAGHRAGRPSRGRLGIGGSRGPGPKPEGVGLPSSSRAQGLGSVEPTSARRAGYREGLGALLFACDSSPRRPTRQPGWSGAGPRPGTSARTGPPRPKG